MATWFCYRSILSDAIDSNHQWAAALDEGRRVDMAFLDFSKPWWNESFSFTAEAVKLWSF